PFCARPTALLRLLPLLGSFRRSAISLRIALEQTFLPYLQGAAIEIRECTGTWTQLNTDEWLVLGVKTKKLGMNAVLGTRVRDAASRFSVRIGPLAYANGQRLLPGGDLHETLCTLIRCFLRDELDFDVQLIVTRKSAPSLVLGSRAAELGK